MIPCKYVRFAVPYNATNISISCVRYGYPSIVNLDNSVYPVQQDFDGNTTEDQVYFTLPMSNYYFTPVGYPFERAWLVDDGFYHGCNRIITVAMCPFTYYGHLNRLEIARYNVTISYSTNSVAQVPASGGIVNLSDEIARVDTSLINREMNLLKGFVANPEQVESFAHGITPYAYPYPDIDNDPGGYNYCIITNRELAPAFKKLVALKRQKGYSAGTVCVEDIIANPFFLRDEVSNLQDSAASVRQYLRFAHRFHSTQFVLFGGKESSGVPVRYIDTQGNYNYNTPSDVYFSDLDMNWSISARNGAWLTFNFAPELYVGRLLCDSLNHITNYTDKLLKYEFNPGNGNANYLKKALYMQNEIMQSSKECQFVQEFANGIFSDNDTTLIQRESFEYPLGTDVINNINENKYGYISLHGHGCPVGVNVNQLGSFTPHKRIIGLRGWNLCPSSGRYLNEDGNSLESLTNKYFPNIMYSMSCTTMPYDIFYKEDENYTYDLPMNFGASFTLGKDYGGVAFLGNTRDGYCNYKYGNGLSTILEGMFLSQLNNSSYKIGIAESNSKWIFSHENSLTSIHVRLTHNLLGDPEVEMWTDIPSSISNYNIVRNNNGIQVSGSLPDSCIVAYCDNNGHQGMLTYTGETLNLSNISPNSCIMLYKHNYLPAIAPLTIQNGTISKSQYVFASTLAIGKNVDSGRTQGSVTIGSGAEYEVEATGDVLLGDGLIVEDGATLRIWTPGTVTISGGTIKNGATVEIFANEMVANGAFNCELGSNVKIDNYSPLR